MVDKELIEIWRNELKPAISLLLLNINYEEVGEQDKEEFERDFDEFLDLALIGLNTSGESKPMGDLIERQAAIDAVDKIIERDTSGNNDVVKAMTAWKMYVEALPSAQPERTCVNCGRTANNGGWYADGGTRCPIEEHYALPKDGFCHLWEKRNVTDDDYPERRTDE